MNARPTFLPETRQIGETRSDHLGGGVYITTATFERVPGAREHNVALRAKLNAEAAARDAVESQNRRERQMFADRRHQAAIERHAATPATPSAIPNNALGGMRPEFAALLAASPFACHRAMVSK